MKKRLIATLAGLACAFAAHAAYPEKPVTVIVPFAPGGSTDTVARMMRSAMVNAAPP